MKLRTNLYALALLLLSCVATVNSARPQQGKNLEQGATATKDKDDDAAEGAKRFAANCGRCHQTPEDISASEAKAVVRHMRVRAMLTGEDERLILKFIAP